MKKIYKISRYEWHRLLVDLTSSSYNILVPVKKKGGIDYALIDKDFQEEIIYNEAIPFTPLKMFFLPVRLNVTDSPGKYKKTIIIGPPACDIEGLNLLDQIYLDKKFCDETYMGRRENTLLVSSDCYITREYCHCTTYGINPYPSNGCDISLSSDKDALYLITLTEKGEKFLRKSLSSGLIAKEVQDLPESVTQLRKRSIQTLKKKNLKLPGTEETGLKTEISDREIWKKFSSLCVSCGACSAICPTCTCFLLIDKPGFGKVKQLDSCQYPAFERVAGGGDPLKELHSRFRNRYMCKYVWKPKRFSAVACTGCGRCIEACISKISKNEIIMELI